MTATRPPSKRPAPAHTRPLGTRSLLSATPAARHPRPGHQHAATDPAPNAELTSDAIPVGVFTSDLSQRLAAAEQDLRRGWARLLVVSSEAAERLSEAGRFVHRAKRLLDDNTVIR